ncbi:hypothetical protein [Amycolatopsis sp. FDAARGOS 1241]|uniref:hypothetical protein n=1 Tax=Amycolatopsis sp. FDAARGOS 1241 TaxID=2778070 RepID=UPI00194E9A64|nr:hypothetical protein [Amycolatopsis sp. FDAARGOS 1241]QRP45550.1 hypothetical protein I6J71_41575 [Amycolatopsis sp. FDAARGOS 1241]
MVEDKLVPTGEAMWRLLREADEPGNPEIPHGYDHAATRQQFLAVAARLDADFGCRTDSDLWVQDASLHARLDLPEEVTRGGEKIYVAVSNFASLAIAGPATPARTTAKSATVASTPRTAGSSRRLLPTSATGLWMSRRPGGPMTGSTTQSGPKPGGSGGTSTTSDPPLGGLRSPAGPRRWPW